MLRLTFSEEDIKELDYQRYHHPHPRVQRKMEARLVKAKAVLPTLPIAGRVLTSDALHTHAAFMQITHNLRGKSLFTVKGNQPTLYADLATSFADPHA